MDVHAMKGDILVVGGGLAGAAAALRARERSRDVVLVRRAYGATALGTGCFDVAGDIVRVPGEPWGDSLEVPRNIAEISRRRPSHPFSIVGGEGRAGLRPMAEWLFNMLAMHGYEAAGSWEKNTLLPTVLGAVKTTAFFPGAYAEASLMRMRGATVLIVGVSGLCDVFPPHLCRSLHGALAGTPLAWEACDHAEVGLKGWISRTVTSPGAARTLDDPDASEAFIRDVRARAGAGRYSHILLPPVLGLTRWKETLAAVSRETGARCAEMVPSSPSVPGMRLQRAIDALLEGMGVTVVHGEATGLVVEGRTARKVTVMGAGGPETWRVNAVILATGRFVGGGIAWGRRAREALADLPLLSGGEPLSAGVRVNAAMVPCTEARLPLFENVSCAGSVIGGYDPAEDMSGSGVALLTGAIAGENAARQ